jgi:MoaA/NifB/PqqE/SkfB family radical SAM enzyme
MFSFNNLKKIHVEITNNCQASCPMCSRNHHGGIKNSLIKNKTWSIKKYKKIISPDVLKQINMIYFCGNYGDPLLCDDLVDMIEYSVSLNSDIEIRIHTNGSLRGKDWWQKLAKVLPSRHCVIFALDGLEDTHRIYRIGTDYKKIINNAKHFINAGGTAEWAFIRFKHNEHQVEQAKNLASELNFKEFTVKDSSRFLIDTKFPVYNKDKNIIYYLEPSQYSELKFINEDILKNYKNIVNAATIKCHALHEQEIYINAQGNVFPCCWLALIPYQTKDELKELLPIREEILNQYYDLVNSLGGINKLNAEENTIEEIVNSDEYQSIWKLYWGEKKLITCARTCGIMSDLYSTPQDQFISRDNLNT